MRARTGVCQGPPHADGREHESRDADQDPQHAARTCGDERCQDAAQQEEQGDAGSRGTVTARPARRSRRVRLVAS
ncbi:hypothetical protein QFZ63_005442 [Streptomyces sp. B3I7]|nr:hypothetical protein [Streptomyces sp. B3I7]